MNEAKPLGKVVHYFDKIGVAVVRLEGDLKVGDRIRVASRAVGDYEMEISSMEIEHEAVREGRAGEEVAIKVDRPVKKNDVIFAA